MFSAGGRELKRGQTRAFELQNVLSLQKQANAQLDRMITLSLVKKKKPDSNTITISTSKHEDAVVSPRSPNDTADKDKTDRFADKQRFIRHQRNLSMPQVSVGGGQISREPSKKNVNELSGNNISR